MNIENLFKVKNIAIVGISENKGFGKDVWTNMSTYMTNTDNIYFVNPKRDEMFSRKCYKSISDIEVDIDLLVICSNKNTVINSLIEGSKKNVKSAVVYASGFSEVGYEEGINLEKELIKTAKELDIALMGPNCAGFNNFNDNIFAFAFLSEKRDRKGNVAFVSQSGQLALSMMDSNQTKLSYCISCGNGAIFSIEDYLLYVVEDDNTKVISCYIEGIKDFEKFEKFLMRANELNKKVVILKVGRSKKGKEMTASHTGSVENNNIDFDNLLKKYKIIKVDDLEELITISNVFSVLKTLPKNKNVCSLNLSGGEASIVCDIGNDYNINFPDFNKETSDFLAEQLPFYATVHNPLDMTVTLSYDTEHFSKVLELVMDDDNIGMIIISYTLLFNIDDECPYYLTEGIKRAVSNKGLDKKPILMLPFISNTRNVEYQEKLRELGVPILSVPKYAFSAIKKILDII